MQTMTTNEPAFHFGPRVYDTDGQESFWGRHAEVMRAWHAESGALPSWRATEFAAHCLVDYCVLQAEMNDADPSWRLFDLEDFLFVDVWSGGSMGLVATPEEFFEAVREVIGRLERADALDGVDAGSLLSQLATDREDFIRCYDEATDEREAMAIARRHTAADA